VSRAQNPSGWANLLRNLIVMGRLPEAGVLLCLRFVLGVSLAQIGQKRYRRPRAKM
jgi:hypothetical protein